MNIDVSGDTVCGFDADKVYEDGKGNEYNGCDAEGGLEGNFVYNGAGDSLSTTCQMRASIMLIGIDTPKKSSRSNHDVPNAQS